MRDEQTMLDLILKVAQNDQRIRSVVLTGSRAFSVSPKDMLQDYDIIYGVTSMENFRNKPEFMELFGEPMILQLPDERKTIGTPREDAYGYICIFTDGVRLDLTLIPAEFMPQFILEDSLAKVLMDKDGNLPATPKPNDIKYRSRKPTRIEFDECCNEFFMASTDVAKGLYRSELIYAIKMYQKCKDMLDRMLVYYLGTKYDFHINVGVYGKNVKTYLETEYWDKLMKTYPVPERTAMWATLFNTCMLFRKFGLEVAEKLEYDYPKVIDREVVRYLRHIWNLFTEM